VRRVVLIVDDERDTRDLLALTLSLLCCAIKVADTLAHALEIIERAEELHFIIVDRHLPGIDLEHFVAHARAHHPDATIIVASSAGAAVELAAQPDGLKFLALPPAPGAIEAVLTPCRHPVNLVNI
jgi:DNA-binding NtrC family response regulator